MVVVVVMVMRAEEARDMVMVVVAVLFLQIWTAASRRGICPTVQLFSRSRPFPDPWTLSLLALTLLLEAKWPCL
jgi:hypothetical protein